MKITVLGNNGPYPGPKGTCSGYLLQDNDVNIIIDFGNGTMSKLLQVCSVSDINAIILTHLHPDHISDIFILRYALKRRGIKIPLYAPSSPAEEFNRLQYEDVFEMHPIVEGKIAIEHLTVEFKKLKHIIDNFGISIKNARKKFVYTGDTSCEDCVVELADKADLLLIEAALLDKDLKKGLSHLSARQACEIGNRSGARQIILTHFNPDYDLTEYLSEVDNVFNGITQFAESLKSYYI
ncbi:MAG: MBL fold metallo-hydrolase [Eubacteriaceae bacterium]|nr:MBL fold metallo-hydrolase [Eubacteriaceae bacterium]